MWVVNFSGKREEKCGVFPTDKILPESRAVWSVLVRLEFVELRPFYHFFYSSSFYLLWIEIYSTGVPSFIYSLVVDQLTPLGALDCVAFRI